MPASAIVRMRGREPSIREYLACIVFEVVVQRSSEPGLGFGTVGTVGTVGTDRVESLG